MKFIIIGGSWGSLDPIVDILSTLPKTIDAAILIVRHTAPHSPPLLVDILRPESVLPVCSADDQLEILPGFVYVAAPGRTTEVRRDEQGVFRFTTSAIAPNEKPTPNIDHSLISGAELFDEDCIAVVLSGYLDDGTRGAQVLASHHGVTIVQLPAEAEADSMPLNVIHRDTPDFVVRCHRISTILADLAGSQLPEDLPLIAQRY